METWLIAGLIGTVVSFLVVLFLSKGNWRISLFFGIGGFITVGGTTALITS